MHTLWRAGLFAVLAVLSGGRARAEGPRPNTLACAVESSARPLRAAELCQKLERELGRPLALVDDARSITRGEAVQLIQDDVHWVVIWLTDGSIRAWTRVSKLEAADDQVRFLGRALRALAKVAKVREPSCVRLDPNAGHKVASPELTYPWAELRPCKRRQVEVVDPWWTAPPS